MPESNRRHQAPEACALSAELIALKHNKPVIPFFVKGDLDAGHSPSCGLRIIR